MPLQWDRNQTARAILFFFFGGTAEGTETEDADKSRGVPLINRIREYEDTDNWTIPFARVRSLVYVLASAYVQISIFAPACVCMCMCICLFQRRRRLAQRTADNNASLCPRLIMLIFPSSRAYNYARGGKIYGGHQCFEASFLSTISAVRRRVSLSLTRQFPTGKSIE